MPRSKSKPVTPGDKKLSAKHLMASIAFNKDHAKEHLKMIKHDKKMLKKIGKKMGKVKKAAEKLFGA